MDTFSKINSLATIQYLTTTPENQYLERKGIEEAGLKPTKLANELIGMLNADGGILALGISDDGTLQDISTLETSIIDRYRKVLHDFVKPPANAKLEELTTNDGKLIFLYHVESDHERLFSRLDNDQVYRRVADSNKGPLSNDAVDKLRYDKSIRSFEDQTRSDFDPLDIDARVIDLYRDKINFEGSNEELLVKRNLAIRQQNNTLLYRNSAILLFTEDPDKYIPSAFIRYVRYKGEVALAGEEYNVIKDERFYGNIPRLIASVRKFIYASLDDYFYLDLTSGRFVSVSEYPQDAWQEGLVNALFHRSYNLQGNSIYVKHYDDRLEISNSGPLPAQVTIENIRDERFSRNPRVGRVLSEMGYVRELNEGVNRIYNSMEKSMLSKPIYTDKHDIVTLILKNKISKHEKSIPKEVLNKITDDWSQYNETEKLIINHLFNNFKATVDDFASAVNVTPQAVRSYLNKFCKQGLMERHSDKVRDRKALYSFRKT